MNEFDANAANPQRVTQRDKPMQLDAYLNTTAAMVGLPIPAECRTGVPDNLERMQRMAAQVMDFPLPPDAESASTCAP